MIVGTWRRWQNQLAATSAGGEQEQGADKYENDAHGWNP
jgi:hypothetical protein